MSERLLPPEQRIIRKITDKAVPLTAADFITAARKFLGSIDLEALTKILKGVADVAGGSPFALRDALRYEAVEVDTLIGAFEIRLQPLMEKLLLRAGEVGVPVFAETLGVPALDLGTYRSRAVKAARELVGEAITLITHETRQAVREIVADGFAQGQTPRQIANRLAQTVGLDARRARGFETFLQDLQDDPPDLSEEQIQRLIDREYSRRLKSRGLAIARTETAAAAAAAQSAIWDTAIDEGKLQEQAYVRVWVRIPAAKPCPICGPLQKKRARIRGGYYVGAGGKRYYRPPGHTNCRCGEFLDRFGPGDEFLPGGSEAVDEAA